MNKRMLGGLAVVAMLAGGLAITTGVASATDEAPVEEIPTEVVEEAPTEVVAEAPTEVVEEAAPEQAKKAEDHKVWVCKYVGKPGEDERLKDGKNPIEVDSSATVGTFFKDGQNRSYVLGAFAESPGLGACPAPDDGPDWTPPVYPLFNRQECVEYKLAKSVSNWDAKTGTWSAWADYTGADPLAWGASPKSMTGHHGGTHEANGDRHYAYFVVDERAITTDECAPQIPEQPGPTPRTASSVDCESGVFTTITYEMPWVLDTKLNKWVPDVEVELVLSGRAATSDELSAAGCEIQIPDPERLRLTFIQDCGVFTPLEGPWVAPGTVQFRLRNGNASPTAYLLRQAGGGIVRDGMLPVGDTFVDFLFGARTLILETHNVDGVKVHQDSKAGGNTFLTTTEPSEQYPDGKCTPTTPGQLVDEGAWQGGTFECGDTTVEQTRAVTTTSYEWNGEEFAGTETTETETRSLKLDEIVPCPTTPPPTIIVEQLPPPASTPPVVVEQLPSTTPSGVTQATREVVASFTPAQAPTTTAPAPVATIAVAGLPATGSDGIGVTALIALLVTSLGGAALLAARRRNVTI